MIRFYVITFNLFFTFICLLPSSFAQSAEEILAGVEQKIKNTTFLSYHADFKRVNPTLNDSVSSASGTVWLKKMPADSVFGCHFHLQGEDESGEVDYFYDGQNSYEFRHEDKKIIIFHPHERPNNPNNPAKARTALSPFRELLIDENLKSKTFKNHSKVTVNEDAATWTIILNYPKNKFGQEITKSLEIDKNTFWILEISQKVKWRGTTSSTKILLSNYKQDNSSTADEIYVSENYEDYSKEEFNRVTEEKNNPYENLIGKPAPSFSLRSFSGNEVSLGQFKGQFVLLDFWESWCGYCILAMPKLNKLQRKWNDDLTIIGIVTENKQPVKKLIKNNGLIYPNLFAHRGILKDYKVTARPTYVLIDQKGVISTVNTGNLDTIESKIHQLIK